MAALEIAPRLVIEFRPLGLFGGQLWQADGQPTGGLLDDLRLLAHGLLSPDTWGLRALAAPADLAWADPASREAILRFGWFEVAGAATASLVAMALRHAPFVRAVTVSTFVPGSAESDPAGSPAPAQPYLSAAPLGVGRSELDAALVGSRGEGVRVVDIEYGWSRGLPDLPDGIEYLHGPPEQDLVHLLGFTETSHGAKVSGVLGMLEGIPPGGQGVCPRARLCRASSITGKDDQGRLRYNLPAAILAAAAKAEAGDVLLVEAEEFLDPTDSASAYMPAEIRADVWTAIASAVERGIIVVAAAGNGNRSIDTIPGEEGANIRRSGRDSGSILVGGGVAAGTPTLWARHDRAEGVNGQGSNRGRRVDCFAQGAGVYSLTGRPEEPFGTYFKGTSAAAAIIAGTAAVFSARYKQMHGKAPTPRLVRDLFTNPALSTPCADGAGIGRMPDLVRLLAHVTPP